jgi:glycosyltransferase involved in cell wall biosynthesis
MKVFLMPSLWPESFGMSAIDAMLRGVPVVASNVGGLPEAKLGVEYVLPVAPATAFARGEAGVPEMVIPPQDVRPWVDALGRLLTDEPHFVDVATRSRDAALAFVGSISSNAYEDVFAACARG